MNKLFLTALLSCVPFLARAVVAYSQPHNGSFRFVNWTDNGTPVSDLVDYSFNAKTSRLLIANFAPAVPPRLAIQFRTNAVVLSWPTNSLGFTLEQTLDFNPTNWFPVTDPVPVSVTNNEVILAPPTGYNFFRLSHP